MRKLDWRLGTEIHGVSMSVALPSLFSLVFMCIGAVILSYAGKVAAKAKRSLSWPSVEGEIAHSAVLYQTQRSLTQDTSNTYKADIAYRYKVKGRNYSSSSIALLDLATSSSGRAQTLVNRYPDKSKVDVYYDPANPADAVLEPGSSSGLSFLYLIGGIFAVGGLFFLVMSLTGHVHSGPLHTGPLHTGSY
jgi:hypothetical protein